MKISHLSFKTKVLFVVGLTGIICGSVAIGVAIHYNKVEFEAGLVEKSRTIHGRLDVVAKYVANQGGLKPMIEKYVNKYKDSSQLTDDDKNIILQQVPIYAAMKVGSEGSEKEHYQFRVFSNEPRNKDNQATPEELEIFNKFEKDPGLTETVVSNDERVVVYRPVRLSEKHECMTCHGHPSTSPWGNGKDILGYKMEDWKDGKLHGVFAVSNNVARVKLAKAEAGGVSSTVMLIIFITLGGGLALLVSSQVIRGPISTIQKIVNRLSVTQESVTAASVDIEATSVKLSQATTEQAASLEETASALEEMSAMVAKNTDNARNTAETSAESQRKADEGKHAVERMIESMDEINQSNGSIMSQVQNNNEQMMEIAGLIRDIGNKTKVINDIVFQTKLLSFNASVEAARAGEQGKGFSVVADEVGKLAQMSGNAAKEISDMLDGSISRVEKIVSETKPKIEGLVSQSRAKVDTGIEVAQQCAILLNEIVNNVTSVASMAGEISSASQEQSHGLKEINQAMHQLNQVTQQNASTSESSAGSASQLSLEATTLKTAVCDLVHTMEGAEHIENENDTNTPAKLGDGESSSKKVRFSKSA